MRIYSTRWLSDECIKLYKNLTGTEPNEKEKDFLISYFSIVIDSPSKQIYYISVFQLKRGYPKFVVYLFIKNAIKKDFKKAGFDILVKMHKDFAKKMLFNAIKAYCKIAD